MSTLPSELLTRIFNRLEIKDLLQCQLTSKQWHRNSLAHTYSYAGLREKSRLFIRTISNSPQLGKYLNDIYLPDVLEGGSEDELRILETIITHCPNITRIRCSEKYLSFWTRLMRAGIQGYENFLKNEQKIFPPKFKVLSASNPDAPYFQFSKIFSVLPRLQFNFFSWVNRDPHW
ncbi:hypothetical protein EDC94DRAFT_644666 [Helicostylum pulchrum]|nr:hypothetical protein EDC94DRAFT_644666 [Helicostylum pulchrum]